MPLKTYFKERLSALIATLKTLKVDAFVIEEPFDLFYITGLKLSRGLLFVHAKGATLFVDGRYIEAASKHKDIKVLPLDEKKVIAFLAKRKWGKIGFDKEKASYAQFTLLKKRCQKAHIKSPTPIVSPLVDLRFRKSPYEVRKLEKSADLLWKGFLAIKKWLKVGVTEQEIARQFEVFCLNHGAEGLSFEPIIAFGANSAMPHYQTGLRKLKRGDVVLIDIGVVLDGYCSDMTRMLFFGKVKPKIEEIFSVLEESFDAALSVCKPGLLLDQMDAEARKTMKQYGYDKYFVHTLGHSLGLEVHEYPRLSSLGKKTGIVLEENMVFTVEPGIYLPGIGGVRYEDMIVVTKTGFRSLFKKTNPQVTP